MPLPTSRPRAIAIFWRGIQPAALSIWRSWKSSAPISHHWCSCAPDGLLDSNKLKSLLETALGGSKEAFVVELLRVRSRRPCRSLLWSKSRYRERIPRMRFKGKRQVAGEQEREAPNLHVEALQPGNTVRGAQFWRERAARSSFRRLEIDDRPLWKCAAVPPLSTATPPVSKTEHEVSDADEEQNKIRVTSTST